MTYIFVIGLPTNSGIKRTGVCPTHENNRVTDIQMDPRRLMVHSTMITRWYEGSATCILSVNLSKLTGKRVKSQFGNEARLLNFSTFF